MSQKKGVICLTGNLPSVSNHHELILINICPEFFAQQMDLICIIGALTKAY